MAKKKPEPKAKRCECIEGVNKKIEHTGFKILQGIEFNFSKAIFRSGAPFLELEKIDRDKKVRKKISVACTFCPFCGKKYPE